MDLELAGVYAALAYYHLNRAEIEADIRANREEVVMEEVGAVGINPKPAECRIAFARCAML